MDQLNVMRCNIALAIIMGAACQFGLAQSKDSAAKDSVQLIATLKGPSSVEGFAFSPDGKILAASYPWHAVIFWDVAKGKRHATLDEEHCSGSLVFTPDGKRLAMASGIWDVGNLKKLIDLEDESGDEADESGDADLAWLTFSRDGKIMASGGFRFRSFFVTTGIVSLREPKDGKVQKKVKVEDGPVHAGDFSPDGKILALATGDRWHFWKMMFSRNPSVHAIHGRLKLLDIAKGKIVQSLTAHEGSRTEALKFSPDGRILATGGGNVVKLWDAATWKEQCSLKGHEMDITSLAFSPDGKLLASADRYSVKLWDVANRRELAELSKQLKGGNSVAFAPQGCILATGFEDQPYRYHDPNPTKEVSDETAIRLWQVRVSLGEKRPK